SKTFRYSVRLDLKDSYGNQYPPFTPPPIFVNVQVSDQKRNAAIAANTSFDIWAGESVAALALVWCPTCAAVPAAIATAAAGSLGIAGKIASDPPSPD